ncbi:BcSTE50, mitogen-activated protein kinase [Amylocarpus encephaloides]|uniref:BcSTE50, mitogen-activated protein kinase n=1 Tax=Amylocarpus encephaloides TaxID=45428 RepID=A0A9P7YHN9_9HELO|nr:BcSTE50, mitogen-activated protein kinase [Amylocarpus encephaloides]
MAFESGTAYPESDVDADDEFETSVRGHSPQLSPTSSDGISSSEHTPTTYGAQSSGDRLPEAIVTEWTAEECADFVASLGLRQYADQFLENEIVGEALVALLHDDLKQMGVASVGHRLTILKSVYDLKTKQDIPIESDHYDSLSADVEAQYPAATTKDIKFLVDQLRLRDERISHTEYELQRLSSECARLREDMLPVFRMAKEGQPLPPLSSQQSPYPYDGPSTISPPAPTPSSGQSGGNIGLARKYSTKKFVIDVPKNASPTYMQSNHERSMMERALDPTDAVDRALATSHHLGANGGSQPATSPGYPSPTQSSPTTLGGSTLNSRSYGQPTPARSEFESTYQQSTYSRDPTKPAPRRAQTPALDTPSGSSGGGASVEIFKSFRVSMEDPCYKVLPAALKKYNINAPWEQYALYIVFGDQERCLGMDEKPLILFKQLDKEGKKPMFMLRKLTSNADGQAGDIPGSAGLDPGRSYQNTSYADPPGGII